MDKITPGDLVFWKDNQIFVLKADPAKNNIKGNILFNAGDVSEHMNLIEGLFCWDTAERRQHNEIDMFGKWSYITKYTGLPFINWVAIPFEEFPNEFKAALLLLK